VVFSGGAALQQSREFQPALLISDVIMPDMSGIEVAIRVREMVPGCEILLLSGQAATADLMRQATAAGHFFELLSKPIPPQELLRHVARHIRHLPPG
jgi:CheY-like chemotaxis protein